MLLFREVTFVIIENDYNNYDYVITNDGSLEDLNKKIKELVDEVL